MPDHDSYRRSAAFYDRLYAFKDYATVLGRVRDAIAARHPSARSVLDVGCGTGVALADLRRSYEVEGTDLSGDMLAVARERCPDVPLHEADMSDLDLGRTFDVVLCMFSAIGYVVTPERLGSAADAFARHLAPGGLLLLEPWFTPQTYWSGHLTVNHVDDEDFKATWMYVAERDGERSVFDIHYLIGSTDGVSHVRERHEMGLFTHEQYVQALTSAGLEVEHEHEGFFGRGLYRGRKPGIGTPAAAP